MLMMQIKMCAHISLRSVCIFVWWWLGWPPPCVRTSAYPIVSILYTCAFENGIQLVQFIGLAPICLRNTGSLICALFIFLLVVDEPSIYVLWCGCNHRDAIIKQKSILCKLVYIQLLSVWQRFIKRIVASWITRISDIYYSDDFWLENYLENENLYCFEIW